MPLEAPTLTGRVVQLEPLGIDHVEALVNAATQDRTTYDWTVVPPDHERMLAYVHGLLHDRGAGTVVPFVQRRLADDTPVGCTRFMRLEWWAGRELPDEVEVGGTWLSGGAQRSGINTEAKYLLFRHAFEVWQVQRVCLCTDARNQRSRNAIARVGGQFEGILRNHRGSWAAGETGELARDSAMYGITSADWPTVRARLESMLR